MTADLFDLPQSLSPRLQWLERHGLTLTKQDDGSYQCALDEENFGTGDSEEAACVAFCAKTGLSYRGGWWVK